MRNKIILGAILVGLVIGARLVPHLPNFVPVTAAILVAGVYLGKKWAWYLILPAMLISDLLIGLYDWRLMLSVYGSFAVIGLFSWWLGKNKTATNIVSVSLMSSLWFFVVTNFAVWMFSPWYAKTAAGLLYCFQLALPFFRYTLFGDIFYSVVMFGSIELVYFLVKKRQIVKGRIVA